MVKEADVLVHISDRGLLHRLARVSDDPALAQREVEDAVQEAEVVARALDRLVVIEADRHELLYVLLRDVSDRLVAEERRHMHAEVALVAHRGRHLPALGDQLPDQPRTSLLDRHPLEQRRDRYLGHQLSQPGLGHLAGQAVAASRRADRPELAGDRPVPNAPLAIPGIALLEDAARAVPPFRGAAWLQRGRVLRGHRPFIRPRRPPARLRASVLIRPPARTVNWRSAAGPAPPRRHDRPPAKRRGNSYGRRGSTGSRWAVAATRATAQLPNTRVTTLAEGQSPPPSRSSASPPRRRACVRVQSYDDGNRP